jgi:hypothetical protein
MPGKSSLSIGRIAMFVVAAIAVLFVLRFVASITWAVLKYGVLAGLGVFVVYLFMSQGSSKKVEGEKERDRLSRR